MKRISSLLCATALVAAPTVAEAQDIPQQSLRIATYNAYLLSPIFKCLGAEALLVVPIADCLAQIDGETEEWAERLASTIIADRANIDVIAINEAWDEDAKKILRQRLRPYYPVQVYDIDKDLIDVRAQAFADLPDEFRVEAGVRFNGEDSGLMLFAKPQFRVLPLPSNQYRWGSNTGETLGATTPEVAFTLFGSCAAEDCLAAKGAGLIRLQHEREGPVYNIVFTHMQADYPPDRHNGARDGQFRAVRKLIEETLAPLPSHIQANEVVILLGDLNVPYLKHRSEWDDRFGDGPSFFRSPLYETAHHTSSRDDLTATNNTDEERLDYILASPRPAANDGSAGRQRCVQHVTYPLNFHELESDHDMVRADINRGFYHCSPSIAFPVKLGSQGAAVIDRNEGGTTDVTGIGTGGAMQWFEVQAEGTATYSIGPDTLDVVIEIYLPEDLTTPVSRYNKTPGTLPPNIRRSFAVNQYVLPGHFFIRTSGRTRQTTANYALLVRRHDCSTKATACILQPGTLQTATLSPSTLPPGQLSHQDEAWFRFDAVGQADSGAPQTLTITASIADEPRVGAKIEDYSDPLGGTLTEAAMTNIRSYTGPIGDGGKGFLVIRQSSRAADATPVKAVLDTNLRFISFGQLICFDETNPELGSDEIFSRIRIDGNTKRVPGSGYAEFDCNNSQDAANWGGLLGGPPTKTFVDGVSAQLFEEDDVSDDDEARRMDVPNLANEELSRQDKLRWTFEDGDYRLFYELRRRPNQPVADP